MKKLLVLTSALLLMGASIASAAAPGANLGWTNCGLTATSSNIALACDDNTLTRNLIVSFRVPNAVSDFVGVSTVIDVAVAGGALPAYWQLGAGQCREGSVALGTVGTLGGCTNTYSGANQAGGYVFDSSQGPNRIRFRADWVRDTGGALVANTLYSGLVLGISTVGAFDEGFGSCAGCSTPACFVLNGFEAFSLLGGSLGNYGADVRNWATYQGGIPGPGGECPGVTPTRSNTWGGVKALYR
ncbi:MAG: hypothetical protein HOP12_07825 [Candidatus Eisenbacteria bacterium]|uniref:Uncharacterized protein n=1 Tax=Eiseniibacteriota bacterium TaxID=2212470 RepID=A0A849SK52_UNCEI|nr:hypothetical protein [Candidatus Eisenbacteria bacterium]